MPDTKCRLTVLLPFYQVDNTFYTAIESIVRQTYTNWRLLLISNNGNEKGLEIARLWIKSDQRIQLIEEPRQGIAHALNAGLQMADTEYLARMDADDQSHPDRFALQLSFLDAHQKIDVVSTQTYFTSDIAGSNGYSIFADWQNSIIDSESHAMTRFIESPLAHPTVMFRRSLLDKYGLYSTRNIPEDYELWLRWMDKGIRFHKIPYPLVIWNDHEKRLSRTHDNYSREAFYQIKCEYLARWIRRNLPPEKKIIVCGSSRIGRKRAALLQELGVDIYGFTDVKKRPNRQVNFIRYTELTDPGPWFLINFIARRGVGQAIRDHFSCLGFREGIDFILAA